MPGNYGLRLDDEHQTAASRAKMQSIADHPCNTAQYRLTVRDRKHPEFAVDLLSLRMPATLSLRTILATAQ
jgi:hypothetical protein